MSVPAIEITHAQRDLHNRIGNINDSNINRIFVLHALTWTRVTRINIKVFDIVLDSYVTCTSLSVHTYVFAVDFYNVAIIFRLGQFGTVLIPSHEIVFQSKN